jgi:hypothetical protein
MPGQQRALVIGGGSSQHTCCAALAGMLSYSSGLQTIWPGGARV